MLRDRKLMNLVSAPLQVEAYTVRAVAVKCAVKVVTEAAVALGAGETIVTGSSAASSLTARRGKTRPPTSKQS